jgi:hypothetical protein
MNLTLYLDTVNKRLVCGPANPAPFTMPYLAKGEAISIKLQLLDTNAGSPILSPYVILDATTGPDGCKVAVGDIGGVSPMAWVSLTFSPSTNFWTGTLDLNTDAINTKIGTAASVGTSLEIQLGATAYWRSTFSLTLTNQVIPSTTFAPVPTETYLTRNESLATFARQIGLAGQTITLLSPNGQWARVFGVNDDGSRQDDVYPVT